MKIESAALIGMGAIGTVYGKLLHQKYGSDFAVIADGIRGEKLKTSGVTLNQESVYPRVITGQEENFKAGLILVCVKNYQLDQAIADIRNYVDEETVILPLLNGIRPETGFCPHFRVTKCFTGFPFTLTPLEPQKAF